MLPVMKYEKEGINMINKHTKLFIGLKKMCVILLAFSLTFGMFSLFTLQDSSAEEAQKIKAIKVSMVSYSPYFVQQVWLEPNTEYVLSYLYSGVLPSDTVAIKGTNQNSFEKKTVVTEAGEYNRASMTFTTTDAADSDAVVGTGENAGKIQAYVGIRNFEGNTAAVDTYYADFALYKKSDESKTNVISDTEFTSLGKISEGATWNGLFDIQVQNFYQRAEVDKELFKKPFRQIKAIKVSKVELNPYFVQKVWLEPNTEYVLSYLYSSDPASEMVALKEEKAGGRSFVMQNAETDEGEYSRISVTFTTTNSSDRYVTMGTGENAGKIMAYVGIRNSHENTAAINTYYTDFVLYKKSDESKTNIIRDGEFDSLGTLSDGAVWNCLNKKVSAANFYSVEEVGENLFKKQNGLIKVAGAQIDQSDIGQWVELEDGATYYTSFYFTTGIDVKHFVIEKDTSKEKHFSIESITYDDEYLKATVKFIAKGDEITKAYARSVKYDGDGVLAYISFRAAALDNGYIYDWQLYKEGAEDENLFKDKKITRLGAEKDGGSWYSIDKSAPSTSRFSVETLDNAGGKDAFLIPEDLAAPGGNNVLQSSGRFDFLLLQAVSLKAGKNYKFSYYYKSASESTCTMVTSPTNTDGSIHTNIISKVADKNYYKLTVEFKAPKIGEFDAVEDPENPGNVIVYVGVRAVSGRTQYYYDFRLYESGKTENDNILLDNDFKYLGYKWKQRYYEAFAFASSVSLSSLEGGLEFFHRVDTSKLTGDGTDYVIKVSGEYTPFLLQKVSLTPGVTYSFSFYHSNVISKGNCFTGTACIQLKQGDDISSDYIESIVNDKEWKKTTTTFVCPEIGVADAEEDPNNPGKVVAYVGVRYFGDDQYASDEKPLYFYNFRLYETDSAEQKNILIDNDYEYFGETWYQFYFEAISQYSKIPVTDLPGGAEWFKKISGPDIKVPSGDKMMSYGSNDGVGYLYIDLPYTVKKNHTNGKYYILSINIRPTKGREPLGFLTSTYSGATTAVSPISVEGYTYKFFVQERYNFRFGIQIQRNTSGYISGLEMYEADIEQNIIGKENVATAFGKNGTFADWTVQPGMRWMELTGGSIGLYPGELPADYTGRTCGTLVPMPKDYFVLKTPGKWWNAADVVAPGEGDVGTVSGTVRNTAGAAIGSASLKLVSMSGEYDFLAVTDRKGNFKIENVPVGGYELYIVEDDGTQVLCQKDVWIEQKGDKVNLSLTYKGNGINVKKTVISGGIIDGYIFDKSGAPISGLTVELDDGSTAVTDEKGYFEFASVAAGVHSIYIQGKDGKLKIADIMVSEGIAYQLTAADGSPLVYDPDAGTVSNSSTKQSFIKKNEASNSNVVTVIVIVAAVVVLAAATVLVLVFVKKKKKHTT